MPLALHLGWRLVRERERDPRSKTSHATYNVDKFTAAAACIIIVARVSEKVIKCKKLNLKVAGLLLSLSLPFI